MTPTRREFWRELHKIADSLAPEQRKAFHDALKAIRGAIDPDDLARALTAQDIQRVMKAVKAAGFEKEFARLQRVLPKGVERGAEAAAESMAGVGGVTLSFDLKNPRAQAWLKQHGGALVREVSEETRLAIRNLSVRMFEQGIPPRKAGRMLRDSIGLTSHQEGIVSNYRQQLLDVVEGVTDRGAVRARYRLSPRIPADLTEARAEQLVEKYRQRWINHRARVIATHEPLQAAQAGKRIIWEEMGDAGAFEKSEVKRGWIVTPDDRLCPICAPMVGQVVGFDEAFVSDYDGSTAQHGGQMHILCRCDDVLLLDEEDVERYRGSGQGVVSSADAELETLAGCGCFTKAHRWAA